MAGSGSRTELHPPQRPRFGPSRLAAFGALVIIGLGIAVAAPVYAFVSTSSHEVKVHKFARGSTTATCPKGEHVAFGGVVAQYQPAGPGPKYVLPTGMRRTADDRLTAYGFDNSRATEGHLTAVAHCDRGNVATAVEKSQLLPGGEGGSVVATCPAGTVVVGGGFDTYGGPRQINLVDRLERVSARQWLASANSITPNPTNLTAIAYCRAGRRSEGVLRDGESPRPYGRHRPRELPVGDFARLRGRRGGQDRPPLRRGPHRAGRGLQLDRGVDITVGGARVQRRQPHRQPRRARLLPLAPVPGPHHVMVHLSTCMEPKHTI